MRLFYLENILNCDKNKLNFSALLKVKDPCPSLKELLNKQRYQLCYSCYNSLNQTKSLPIFCKYNKHIKYGYKRNRFSDIYHKYENRSNQLEHLCLAEFAIKYKILYKAKDKNPDNDDDDLEDDLGETETKTEKMYLLNRINKKKKKKG